MQLIAARNPVLYAEYQRMLGYYEHYKLGHLPIAGGLVDQPARVVDWLTAIARSDAATQKAFMGRDETARKEQERALAESRREDAQRRRGGVAEEQEE
jgi:hypothetical protein